MPTKQTTPATDDLNEIERALMHAAMGQPPGYHNLDYAWNALLRCGHRPRPENEAAFKEALAALIRNRE